MVEGCPGWGKEWERGNKCEEEIFGEWEGGGERERSCPQNLYSTQEVTRPQEGSVDKQWTPLGGLGSTTRISLFTWDFQPWQRHSRAWDNR